MDLNRRDENNAKNGDKNIRFLIGFLEVIIMFLSTFWVDLRSEKEILTSKFFIDISLRYGLDRFDSKAEA